MGTRQTNTGKENNTSNTTTVWDHIIALEGSVSGDASKVGDLTQLNTTDKTSIVNAVKEIKTQSNSNGSSLVENTSRLDKLPFFDVQQIKDKYYPTDTDYTNAFIQAVSNAGAQTNYLYSRILFPRKNTKYTFNNSTPIVLKNNMHIVFESGAELQYTGAGTSLFTNDATSSSLFLRISGKGRMIVNDKTLFNLRYSKTQTYGFTVIVEDMKFVGSDSTRTGNAFSIGWTDFIHFENCNFNNLNKAIEIIPYATNEIRGNTQIHMDNIGMVNVGTGLEFSHIDKATFRGVDIAQCGIGFLGHSKNLLVKFMNCHVELYDTYAYKIDGDQNVNNSFDECSCFNPSSTALGGFYSKQLDFTASGQNHYSFNNCDFVKVGQTSITGYVSMFCPSPFDWNGIDFEHIGVQKVSNSDYPVGGAKIRTVLNRATSKNLLPITNFNDSSLAQQVDGTLTIASDSTYQNGVKLTWVTTAGNLMRIDTKSLNVGWHTLIVKGSQGDLNNFNLNITRPNFTTLHSQSMAELSWDFREQIRPNRTLANLKTQTLTIPFYVDTAGIHRVAFFANGNTTYSILLGSLAVVTGFVTDYIAIERIWYKSAIPTGGYWYQDDIIYSTNRTSGQPIGWKCSVSGSPGTWLSLGNFA